MPKLKTKTCVAKRFKVTATGKVMMKKAGARHLLSHKSCLRQMQKGLKSFSRRVK